MSLCWELGREPPGGFPLAASDVSGISAQDVVEVEFRSTQGELDSRWRTLTGGVRAPSRVLLHRVCGVGRPGAAEQQEIVHASDGRWYMHYVWCDELGYSHIWWRSMEYQSGEVPRGQWEICGYDGPDWVWRPSCNLECILRFRQDIPKMLVTLHARQDAPSTTAVAYSTVAGNVLAECVFEASLRDLTSAVLREKLAKTLIMHADVFDLILPDGRRLDDSESVAAGGGTVDCARDALHASALIAKGCQHDLC